MIFVFLGIARGLWVITESHLKLNLFSNLIGAGINIVLNILFLPKYGIIGAAYATLISYFSMYIALGLFYKPARGITMIQLRALSLIGMSDYFKKGNPNDQ